jgi:hypothetical protein
VHDHVCMTTRSCPRDCLVWVGCLFWCRLSVLVSVVCSGVGCLCLCRLSVLASVCRSYRQLMELQVCKVAVVCVVFCVCGWCRSVSPCVSCLHNQFIELQFVSCRLVLVLYCSMWFLRGVLVFVVNGKHNQLMELQGNIRVLYTLYSLYTYTAGEYSRLLPCEADQRQRDEAGRGHGIVRGIIPRRGYDCDEVSE